MEKYFLIVGVHVICCFVVLKTILFASPYGITGFLTFVFETLLCLLFSFVTFQFTKKLCLEDKVDVSGKAVFITGCDRGFGHLLAQRLDSQGYHVFAGCFFPSGPGANKLKSKSSSKLTVVELDVTKEESVKRAVEIVKNNLVDSKLWAIVNNAGILKGLSIEMTSFKTFQECMDVNAFGPLRVCKAFLPLLRQSKGRVVNVISVAGKLAVPNVAPYVMSKFAAQAFNDCLRNEIFIFGIDVISIEPDAFKTDMTKPDTVLQNLDDIWDNAEDGIKSVYGHKHLKILKKFNRVLYNSTSPRVHIVVDDIEKAVSSVYPSTTYKPSGNVLLRTVTTLCIVAPSFVYDFIYNVFVFYASAACGH